MDQLCWTTSDEMSNKLIELLATQLSPGNAHMRLNKSTSHAIRILIECARDPGELVKAADLSAALDITMQNTFKIVNILSHAELLEAVRGRNGGVRLAQPASRIRIGDIVRAMETTDIELDIDQKADRGSSGAAAVKGVNQVLDNALEAFVAVLDMHSLEDIANCSKPAKAQANSASATSKAADKPRNRPTTRQRAGARINGRS